MKRGLISLLTVALAAVVAFSGGGTAFALTSSDKASIAVTNHENGNMYLIYKVAEVDFNDSLQVPNDPMFRWDSNVNGWMKENGYESYTNGGFVSSEFAQGKVDDSKLKVFYSKLTAAFTKNQIPLIPEPATGDTLSLPMGLYVVVTANDKGGKIYEPLAISVYPEYENGSWQLASTQDVAIKSVTTLESFELMASSDGGKTYGPAATQQMFKTVTARSEFTVPNYSSSVIENPGYTLQFVAPKGLALQVGTLKIQGMASDGTATDLTRDIDYTVGEEAAEKVSLEIGHNSVEKYNKVRAEINVLLTGDALVYDGTTAGGIMKVSSFLWYTNRPGADGSATSTVPVYTYGVKVKTTDGETDAPLAGSSYQISYGGNSDNPFKMVYVDDGVYRLANEGESSVTQLNTKSDGTLEIRGLNRTNHSSSYELVQVVTPGGYNAPSVPKFSILDDDLNGKVDSFDSGFREVTVENGKGFLLPTTGGMGTTVFSAAGIMLMSASIFLFMMYKRRSEDSTN